MPDRKIIDGEQKVTSYAKTGYCRWRGKDRVNAHRDIADGEEDVMPTEYMADRRGKDSEGGEGYRKGEADIGRRRRRS